MPSPPNTGTSLLHPLPPPIVERLIFPCPRSRLIIWCRETGSAVPSRVSLLISILRLNLVLARFLPIAATAFIYFFKPPYAIGSVPSSTGHAIAYRYRSLPRVRRHRTSKPQDGSKRVLPWEVTMDQLICTSRVSSVHRQTLFPDTYRKYLTYRHTVILNTRGVSKARHGSIKPVP